MAVVISALLFLFGAPALLLWIGRLIQGIARPRPHAAHTAPRTDAWYYRPVQPIFGRDGQGAGAGPAPASTPAGQDDPWYRRAPKPVFALPSWLRRPTFAGHGTD